MKAPLMERILRINAGKTGSGSGGGRVFLSLSDGAGPGLAPGWRKIPICCSCGPSPRATPSPACGWGTASVQRGPGAAVPLPASPGASPARPRRRGLRPWAVPVAGGGARSFRRSGLASGADERPEPQKLGPGGQLSALSGPAGRFEGKADGRGVLIRSLRQL